MHAQFVWAGSGRSTNAHVAFSQLTNSWTIFDPIISWEMTISTASHSAEASVVIPLHPAIAPAKAQLESFGQGSINVGDHCFIQDIDAPTPYGGTPLLHGTIDKVDYEASQIKIHFRNPMQWLADNDFKPGKSFLGSDIVPGFVSAQAKPLVNNSGQVRYAGNYTNTPIPPWAVIADIYTYFAQYVNDGPFASFDLGQGVSGDGQLPAGQIGGMISPNYENKTSSLLSIILNLCHATRWSSPDDRWGLEIAANPIPFGQGFSTDLFVFRAGFVATGVVLDYDGASSTHPVIDYSFPEQFYDVPLTAQGFGSGEVALSSKELNDKMLAESGTLLGKWVGLTAKALASLDNSTTRSSSIHDPAITDKGALANSIIGNSPGIGTNKGFRAGQVRVGGFLENVPLIPGYTAVVNIPEVGLNFETLVIDSFTYSEPEGITTISFNRSNTDNIQGKLQALQEHADLVTSVATSYADSGWFRSDGSVGQFDLTGSLTGPPVTGVSVNPNQTNGSCIINYTHKLGVIPSHVEISVGAWGGGNDILPNTIVTVPPQYPDPNQNQWVGAGITGKTKTDVAIIVNSWIAYSNGLAVQFSNASLGWIHIDSHISYMRIKVYP